MAAAICVLLFLGFYWLIDVRGYDTWARFLMPAGQNPLLAYLLPDVVSSLFGALGLTNLLRPCTSGLPGAVNAMVLTAVVLLLNWGLTRLGIRLKL